MTVNGEKTIPAWLVQLVVGAMVVWTGWQTVETQQVARNIVELEAKVEALEEVDQHIETLREDVEDAESDIIVIRRELPRILDEIAKAFKEAQRGNKD